MDEEQLSQVVASPQPAPTSAYPVSFSVEYPESNSRLLALSGLFFFFKVFLLIPHLVVMYFLNIVAFLFVVLNYIIVLFTGKQNRMMFDYLVGVSRWSMRVNAYLFGLTDIYPPYRLED